LILLRKINKTGVRRNFILPPNDTPEAFYTTPV
jgi:hypothetical protein